MSLGAGDLRQLADTALAAAVEAGEMIARSRPTSVEHKAGGGSAASQVVTEVDRRSEALILDRLVPTCERFDLGLLTEERDDDGSRLCSEYFWSIDPLDGTLPFVEGIPGSAVSIALVRHDGTPMLGVIYDIARAQVVHAIRGGGRVVRDGAPWSAPSRGDALTVFADRSLLGGDDGEAISDAFAGLAAGLGSTGVDVRVGAGAVVNAWGALQSPPACYVKFPAASGGGSLWDFAATACIVHEAGAVATDIHGEPLDLNRPDSTFMHHRGVLVATDEQLAQRIRTIAVDLR